MRIDHVAIVGAGFSGALQAVNLLRHDGPRATLIERRPVLARGVAYSAAHPDHLLNVRAGNMSALPDDPDHFIRWLRARFPASPADFAPRLVYGDYLADLLADAMARAPDRLTLVQDEACDIAMDATNATVSLRSGGTIAADAVILAPGNLPPHLPAGLDPLVLPPGCYAGDPWTGDVAGGLGPDDVVLVLGTGLTMIDVALLLDARGFQGRIVALSRHGLIARAHAPTTPAALPERPSPAAVALVRHVRARAATGGWRAAIDELRPHTQGLWGAADAVEQRRFLRHLRPWWDVHRHRIAPQVAERIGALRGSGRLEIIAGKLVDVTPAGDAARVRFRRRHAAAIETRKVRRIVNATGPQGDVRRSAEPLLRNLLLRGHIRPDSLRIGIDVNVQSETISAKGDAQPRLLAIGPMTRGAFWEIVAVPDLRQQTWSVARRLSNAHWVGGEGL